MSDESENEAQEHVGESHYKLWKSNENEAVSSFLSNSIFIFSFGCFGGLISIYSKYHYNQDVIKQDNVIN